ncbi:MAG: hypothetical protein ACFBSE_17790, partial [Prochloraceae cyanobacterium]
TVLNIINESIKVIQKQRDKRTKELKDSNKKDKYKNKPAKLFEKEEITGDKNHLKSTSLDNKKIDKNQINDINHDDTSSKERSPEKFKKLINSSSSNKRFIEKPSPDNKNSSQQELYQLEMGKLLLQLGLDIYNQTEFKDLRQIRPVAWQLRGKEFTLTFDRKVNSFHIHHYKRGELIEANLANKDNIQVKGFIAQSDIKVFNDRLEDMRKARKQQNTHQPNQKDWEL